MLKSLNGLKSDKTHIFCGYKIRWNHLPAISNIISESEIDVEYISLGGYIFIGKSLVFHWNSDQFKVFSIDSIRDWSTNDSVKLVRETLIQAYPESYKNEQSRLFLLSV